MMDRSILISPPLPLSIEGNTTMDLPMPPFTTDDEDTPIVSFGWADFPVVGQYCGATVAPTWRTAESGAATHRHHKRKMSQVSAFSDASSGAAVATPIITPVMEDDAIHTEKVLEEPSSLAPVFGWDDFPCIITDDEPSIASSPTRKRPKAGRVKLPRTQSSTLFDPVHSIAETSVSDLSVKNVISPFSSALTLTEEAEHGRTVSFGTVEVREYPVIMGDHPMPTSYPLSLDWHFTTTILQSLDNYELSRQFIEIDCLGFHTPRRLCEQERLAILLASNPSVDAATLEAQNEVRNAELYASNVTDAALKGKPIWNTHAGYLRRLMRTTSTRNLEDSLVELQL